MVSPQIQNTKNRLTAKLRLITKKLVKPVASMLFNKRSKSAQKLGQAEPVHPELQTVTELPIWMHPSALRQQERSECDENAANEALEAKLRELIVTEYSQRATTGKGIQHPLSLTIQGHLTIIPSAHPAAMVGTFWTADADICWRDYTHRSGQQRAERQTPLAY